MTKVGKALVIFLAFGSVSFMGFAIVTTLGGTDWKEFLAAKNYDGHTKTLEEFVKAQDEELRQLRDDLVESKALLEAAKKTRDADIAAMNNRDAELVATLAELNQQIVETTDAVTEKGEEVNKIQEESAARRDEVEKLRDQLAELRTQIDVATGEQERLADRVIQAGELLKFAQRRNRKLKESQP